ncbi:unnamed protein product [Lactuca saligna]|uniref:DUF3888 domain-containing protein n=1 Tax=Lactuca saligna TaxID=75948 RepID=A0AA35ZX02_LACSI|nr:unnamed protein product [Lactuca saligna]
MKFDKPRRETMRMVFICLSFCLFISLVFGEGPPSAYDAIKKYNLPIGLLPEGKYKLRYSSTITGMISKNKIEELGGVKAKIAFFWIDIESVNRNGDQIEFKISNFATKDFPITVFNKCPQCY